MTIPTVGMNEETPAAGNYIREGDDRIREHKTQVREVMEVDHVYPSSGQDADAGKHKQVSLVEAADIGSGAEGLPIIGAQTSGGKAELCFTDEDDNDIYLTKAGELYPGSSPTLANWTEVMKLLYPVGIVITLGVSTAPATLFGFGTWAAIAGKVIVGINAGDAEFDTLDETGGAKTVTLTSAQSGVPAHTHPVTILSGGSGVGNGGNSNCSTGATSANTAANASEAHSNLQPYIVKYVWQRTA